MTVIATTRESSVRRREPAFAQGLQHRWEGQSEELAELWTVRQGEKRARCCIVSHPLGWELRLEATAELVRSQVHRDQFALLNDSDRWKTAMMEKGWL